MVTLHGPRSARRRSASTPPRNYVAGPRLWLQLERLEDRTLPSVSFSNSPTWASRGPNPMTGGQVVLPTPNDTVSGAVSRLAPDPGNANVLYVGAANGGVWKTTNALATRPTWTPLTDQFTSL